MTIICNDCKKPLERDVRLCDAREGKYLCFGDDVDIDTTTGAFRDPAYAVALEAPEEKLKRCCKNRRLTGEYDNKLGLHLRCQNCGETMMEIGGE